MNGNQPPSDMIWVSGDDALRLLRQYEVSVLDVHHRALPFWNLDECYRGLTLLCAYDVLTTTIRDLAPAVPRVVVNTHMAALGLAQALRWCDAGAVAFRCPTAQLSPAIDIAADFLNHARNYVLLERFHQMIGSGLASCMAAPARRTIRFQYNDVATATARIEATVDSLLGVQDYQRGLQRCRAEDIDELERITSSLPFDETCGFVSLRSLDSLNVDSVERVIRFMHGTPDISLRQDVNLGGFSAQELQKWWVGIWKWSHAAEAVHASRFDPEHPTTSWPTQLVAAGKFFDTLALLSGLSVGKVNTIAQRLRYGWNTAKSDVFLQPLLFGTDLVSWSTRVAVETASIRNHLKLMSRMNAHRDHAATVIGDREPQVIRAIRQLLEPMGYHCIQNTEIAGNGELGEVDLIAWTSRARGEVLVVEAKAVLPPEDENEQRHVTDELAHGQQQLVKVIRILRDLPDTTKNELFRGIPWPRISSYFGVVMTEQCLATGDFDQSTLPASSVAFIRRWIRQRDLRTPRRLRDALSEGLAAIEILQQVGPIEYHQLPIADVTYELPIMPF